MPPLGFQEVLYVNYLAVLFKVKGIDVEWRETNVVEPNFPPRVLFAVAMWNC